MSGPVVGRIVIWSSGLVHLPRHRPKPTNAVQLLFLHFRVPAGDLRGFLSAWQASRTTSRGGMAGDCVALLLWLVEPCICRPDHRVDSFQLCGRDHTGQRATKSIDAPRRADLCRRYQSRRAWLLQVRRVLSHQPQCGTEHGLRPWRDHSPPRNFVLHLHADRISCRCLPRRSTRIQVPSLRLVRDLFPPPDRRTHTSSQGDDAAVWTTVDLSL